MKMKFNTSEDLKKNTITNSKTDDTKRIIDDSIRSQNNINSCSTIIHMKTNKNM